MEFKLNNMLREVSVAATLGIGYIIYKNRPIKVDEKYLNYEYIPQSPFTCILDQFSKLESDEFNEFLDLIEQFLELETHIREKRIEGGQFKLNRLCSLIQYQAKHMCYNARSSNNSDVITASIDVERDEIPSLLGICENMLKNAILDNF